MTQLLMRLKGAPQVEGAPKSGLHIVDLSSPGFAPEEFADGWSACCEALNGGLWPREKFEQVMRGDPMIREDGILFAANAEDVLISTASVQFGRVCGCVPNWDYSESATLHMVGTRKGCSGLGAGLAVCAAAADYSFRHGVDTMYLTTDDFRIPAIKIYLKIGFRPVLYDDDQVSRWQAIAKALAREIVCTDPSERTALLLP